MWSKPTEKQLAKIPAIYSTEETPLQDKMIHMHFFLAGCDWYAAEYDPTDRIFFGFVVLNGDLDMAEWGNFSLDELMNLKVKFLEVDRDRNWKVRPAREVKQIALAQRWQHWPEVN